VVRAVIVRTAKEVARPDGSYIRFDNNSAVVVSATGEPVAPASLVRWPRTACQKIYENRLAGPGSPLGRWENESHGSQEVACQKSGPGDGYCREGEGKSGKVLRVIPSAARFWLKA